MSKKELTAKEKHFYNEKMKLVKENKRLVEYICTLEKEVDKYKAEVESLNKEGLVLQEMVNKLLEGKDLTEETVRKYIEEDIKHTDAMKVLMKVFLTANQNMKEWY